MQDTTDQSICSSVLSVTQGQPEPCGGGIKGWESESTSGSAPELPTAPPLVPLLLPTAFRTAVSPPPPAASMALSLSGRVPVSSDCIHQGDRTLGAVCMMHVMSLKEDLMCNPRLTDPTWLTLVMCSLST